MNVKKAFTGVIGALLAASVAGCASLSSSGQAGAPSSGAGSSAPAAAQESITIWAWDDNFNIKAANIAKDIYLKNHPGAEVNVVSMALSDIRQKMNTAFAADNFDGMPNIVLIEDYSIGGYLDAFPNVFKDLSAVVNPDDWMSYKTKPMQVDGKIYGVPFDSGVTGMFYRTDYLEQAGYTAADMENITWDQFIEIGKAVKEKTGKSMLQMTSGDLTPLKIMLQSSGRWYVKEDGVTPDILDNEALKEGLVTHKKMIEAGIILNIPGWDAQVQAIQNGDLAAVVDGCWIAPTIKTAADQSGKWALAPTPRLSNVSGSVNASNVGGASWYVIDQVPGADAAVAFLRETLAGNTDYLNQLVTEIDLVSTYKDPTNFTNYNAENAFFGNQRIYESFNQWAAQVPVVSYGINTYAIENIVEEGLQSYLQTGDLDATLQSINSRIEAMG